MQVTYENRKNEKHKMNTLKFRVVPSKLLDIKAMENLHESKIRRGFNSWTNGDCLTMRADCATGMPGSGAGKGGGAGGTVKESGGRLGEFGAAQEEHYFFNKQKEQLKNIKKKLETDKPGDTAQKPEK